MSKDSSVSQAEKTATNYNALLLAAGFMAAGLVTLLVSAYWHSHDGPETWVVLVREVGALLFVTSAVTGLWDLRGKRALTREVLAAAHLSAEVDSAGLRRITAPYTDVDWHGLFAGACRVDLLFTYASTWRHLHATAMRKVAARSDTKMRIVLPDPRIDPLVKTIADRFDYDVEDLRRRINDAIADIQNLRTQAAAPDAVELRLTRYFPAYGYYRFDARGVMTPYAQVPGRVEVPTLEFGGEGFLFAFYAEQFEKLWKNATPSEPSANITA